MAAVLSGCNSGRWYPSAQCPKLQPDEIAAASVQCYQNTYVLRHFTGNIWQFFHSRSNVMVKLFNFWFFLVFCTDLKKMASHEPPTCSSMTVCSATAPCDPPCRCTTQNFLSKGRCIGALAWLFINYFRHPVFRCRTLWNFYFVIMWLLMNPRSVRCCCWNVKGFVQNSSSCVDTFWFFFLFQYCVHCYYT